MTDSAPADEPSGRDSRHPLTTSELQLGNILYRWLYSRHLQGGETPPPQVIEVLATFGDVSVGSVLRAALAQANYKLNEASEATAVPDPEEHPNSDAELLVDVNMAVALAIHAAEDQLLELDLPNHDE